LVELLIFSGFNDNARILQLLAFTKSEQYFWNSKTLVLEDYKSNACW